MKTKREISRRKRTRRHLKGGNQQIKQKYIKKMLDKIKHYYQKLSLLNRAEMYLRPSASALPAFMLKKPIYSDTHIGFEKLKNAIKSKDIKRMLLLPDNIDKENWLNEFYSEFAFTYLQSTHFRDLYNSLQHRRNEFWTLIETAYLPKHITVTEVSEKHENTKDEDITVLGGIFYLNNVYYETVSNRIYKITCKITDNALNGFCDILFNPQCTFIELNAPSEHDLHYSLRHRIFDDNGFRRLNPDKAETLLHTMGTHPEAKQTLTPDVVEEIIKLTSK